eukprot:TRINITY_DN31734_c0_g2_i1.p1 TRINITY_DN31734_c0_g2~~TRINITY_DN31734_c0_g2_i1.p1  ORF type:complete len:342 (-),score=42.81 TRINITY_DN31734_c0_g2_i1:112-1137(-)
MQELHPENTDAAKAVFPPRGDTASSQKMGLGSGERTEHSESGVHDENTTLDVSESRTSTTITSKPPSRLAGTNKTKKSKKSQKHHGSSSSRKDTPLRININGIEEDDMFANMRIQSRDACVDTTDFVAHHLSHGISSQATPQIIHEDSRAIILLTERQRQDPNFPQDIKDVNLLNRSDKLSILQKVSPYVQARSCQTTLSGDVQPSNVTKHVMAQQQLKGQFSKGGDSIFKKAAKQASSSSSFRSMGSKTLKTLVGSTSLQQQQGGDSNPPMATVPPGAADRSSSSQSLASFKNGHEDGEGVIIPPTLLGANTPQQQQSLPDVDGHFDTCLLYTSPSPRDS